MISKAGDIVLAHLTLRMKAAPRLQRIAIAAGSMADASPEPSEANANRLTR